MADRCSYAAHGCDRCPQWRCDCFIDTHPDSPRDLHPEDFLIADMDNPPAPVGKGLTKVSEVSTYDELESLPIGSVVRTSAGSEGVIVQGRDMRYIRWLPQTITVLSPTTSTHLLPLQVVSAP